MLIKTAEKMPFMGKEIALLLVYAGKQKSEV